LYNSRARQETHEEVGEKEVLLEEIVKPGTLEARATLSEEIAEMRAQLSKQLARVRELRLRKSEDPGSLSLELGLIWFLCNTKLLMIIDAFYGADTSVALADVDVMTDAGSLAPTMFTRYTVAPTSTSKSSK
jgi:elongator complex protein 1